MPPPEHFMAARSQPIDPYHHLDLWIRELSSSTTFDITRTIRPIAAANAPEHFADVTLIGDLASNAPNFTQTSQLFLSGPHLRLPPLPISSSNYRATDRDPLIAIAPPEHGQKLFAEDGEGDAAQRFHNTRSRIELALKDVLHLMHDRSKILSRKERDTLQLILKELPAHGFQILSAAPHDRQTVKSIELTLPASLQAANAADRKSLTDAARWLERHGTRLDTYMSRERQLITGLQHLLEMRLASKVLRFPNRDEDYHIDLLRRLQTERSRDRYGRTHRAEFGAATREAYTAYIDWLQQVGIREVWKDLAKTQLGLATGSPVELKLDEKYGRNLPEDYRHFLVRAYIRAS